jgi:hypothetical protein
MSAFHSDTELNSPLALSVKFSLSVVLDLLNVLLEFHYACRFCVCYLVSICTIGRSLLCCRLLCLNNIVNYT